MTRSIYTSVTPLPPGVTRAIVLECLHDHFLMIDLNPLVIKRDRMLRAPGKATPEEYHCTWYEITDRISYLPGIKGQVQYHGCFHDLDDGLQTHIYAPMGLDIKEKWRVGGNEPGEPRITAELGINAPKDGLYIREDVDVSINRVMMGFVKKNLVNAHKELVARMVEKTKLLETKKYNEAVRSGLSQSTTQAQSPTSSTSVERFGASSDYITTTQIHDERDGLHGQSLGTGIQPRPVSGLGAAPPYDSHDTQPAASPPLHEMPAFSDEKGPAELE